MNSVVQNDTVMPFLFFFFNNIHETASFWIKRAVSFKSGARTRQVSNQPLIIFGFFSIASLPISVFAPLVGRVFHFGPWPLNYAIEPLIDQKTFNFFN